MAVAAKAKAESAANTAAGEGAPKPTEKPPVESPVVSTPPVQAVPPSAPKNLSMDEVRAKWSKRFADDFNYGEEDVAKTIDTQLKVFDGSNEEITKVSDSLVNPVTQLKRRTYSAEDVDRWMSGTYKH